MRQLLIIMNAARSRSNRKLPITKVEVELKLIILIFSIFLTLLDSPCAISKEHQRALDETQLIEHGHYRNKRGEEVHSPAYSKTSKAPAGASAKCRDGTYSLVIPAEEHALVTEGLLNGYKHSKK